MRGHGLGLAQSYGAHRREQPAQEAEGASEGGRHCHLLTFIECCCFCNLLFCCSFQLRQNSRMVQELLHTFSCFFHPGLVSLVLEHHTHGIMQRVLLFLDSSLHSLVSRFFQQTALEFHLYCCRYCQSFLIIEELVPSTERAILCSLIFLLMDRKFGLFSVSDYCE